MGYVFGLISGIVIVSCLWSYSDNLWIKGDYFVVERVDESKLSKKYYYGNKVIHDDKKQFDIGDTLVLKRK